MPAVLLRRADAENWLFLLCALLFLFVNSLTLSSLPIVWNDEVMFTDPAINLASGEGFVSYAWYATPDRFWAGNVPLHPFLLAGWLKLWGVGPQSVRWFSCVTFFLAVFFIWQTVIRLNLVRHLLLRMTLVGLIIGGYGITFSYRSARLDSLLILLAAIAFFSLSLKSQRTRKVFLFGIGLLSTCAGLQLVVLFLVLGFLAIIFDHRKYAVEVLVLIGGTLVGLFVLYCIYRWNGAWDDFLRSTLYKRTLVGENSFKEKFLAFRIQFGGFARDASFLILLMVAAAMAIRRVFLRSMIFHSLLAFGLTAAVLVPTGLFLIGVYPIYYSWMAYLPLSICVVAELESICDSVSPIKRVFTIGATTVPALLGLPLLTAIALADRDGKTFKLMDEIASVCVNASDIVWSEPGAYYSSKAITRHVYSGEYKPSLSERNAFNVVIVQPTDISNLSALYGGEWVTCGPRVSPQRPPIIGNQASVMLRKYDLQAYRRIN